MMGLLGFYEYEHVGAILAFAEIARRRRGLLTLAEAAACLLGCWPHEVKRLAPLHERFGETVRDLKWYMELAPHPDDPPPCDCELLEIRIECFEIANFARDNRWACAPLIHEHLP